MFREAQSVEITTDMDLVALAVFMASKHAPKEGEGFGLQRFVGVSAE